MTIKVGGGNGFINVGGNEKREAVSFGQPPKKPLPAVENPFPEKMETRLGLFKILEEKEDYLICKGFDPNAERATPITRGAFKKINVAKPPLLQQTRWDGQTVSLIVDGVATDVSFEYVGVGVRIARATINESIVEEVQRITMDYIVGDSLLCAQVREEGLLDGMGVYSSAGLPGFTLTSTSQNIAGGGRLTWLDFNVSGRCWAVSENESSEDFT